MFQLKKYLWIIVIVVYFLIPVDVIPDVVFPVGYLDDFIVSIIVYYFR